MPPEWGKPHQKINNKTTDCNSFDNVDMFGGQF
jgi:hypothetical protein